MLFIYKFYLSFKIVIPSSSLIKNVWQQFIKISLTAKINRGENVKR